MEVPLREDEGLGRVATKTRIRPRAGGATAGDQVRTAGSQEWGVSQSEADRRLRMLPGFH
jgi:hypothetical protein